MDQELERTRLSPVLPGEYHDHVRGVVFDAVCEALEEEERAWEALTTRNGGLEHLGDRFGWIPGVRAAAELVVGYLAMKRLLADKRLVGFLSPEMACEGGGRMDFWIGGTKGAASGVGIELKYLMGSPSARTVAGQALRLLKDPKVAAAGLIAWGHDIADISSLDPMVRLAEITMDGWGAWKARVKGFRANYRGEATCRVWLCTADRILGS